MSLYTARRLAGSLPFILAGLFCVWLTEHIIFAIGQHDPTIEYVLPGVLVGLIIHLIRDVSRLRAGLALLEGDVSLLNVAYRYEIRGLATAIAEDRADIARVAGATEDLIAGHFRLLRAVEILIDIVGRLIGRPVVIVESAKQLEAGQETE